MRILILDRNRLFAIGIKHFLEASLPDTQAECAQSYPEAVARLASQCFTMALMEIGTARDNGLRVLRRLRADYPQLPMLVFSDYPAGYYGPRVIRAGACGFIGKDDEPAELVRAVTCVSKGKHYVSPELADRLAQGLSVGADSEAPHERLSPREVQIFRMLALGQSVTGIGRALELSVKTVDTHRTKILRKMGMEKREQLARYAFERGFIPSRRLGDRGTGSRTGF